MESWLVPLITKRNSNLISTQEFVLKGQGNFAFGHRQEDRTVRHKVKTMFQKGEQKQSNKYLK